MEKNRSSNNPPKGHKNQNHMHTDSHMNEPEPDSIEVMFSHGKSLE